MATTVEALIVSYNTRDELEVTLQTLLEHQPPPPLKLDIAVLDNGSVDGSPSMVESRFPSVTLIRSSENLGFGKANNALAEQSSADYLLILNSDVIVERDIVTPLVNALAHRPDTLAAGPLLRGVDGRVQGSAQQLPTLSYEFASAIRGKRLGRALQPLFHSQAIVDTIHATAPVGDLRPRDTPFLWATCWVLRRSDVEGQEIFSPAFPMYDEDLDFCRRAKDRGRTFCYVPSVELIHIGGASTESSRAKLRLMRAARRRYYRLHHGRGAELAYAWLLPVVSWFAISAQRIPHPVPRRLRPSGHR